MVFCPPRPSAGDNVWEHFNGYNLGMGKLVLLVSCGWRQEMLLNVLQYTGQSLTTRNYPGANVSDTLAETLDLKYSIVSSFCMLISSCSLIFLIWSSENMIQSFYSTVGSIQTRFYGKILKNYSFLLVKLLPSITHEYKYIYMYIYISFSSSLC